MTVDWQIEQMWLKKLNECFHVGFNCTHKYSQTCNNTLCQGLIDCFRFLRRIFFWDRGKTYYFCHNNYIDWFKFIFIFAWLWSKFSQLSKSLSSQLPQEPTSIGVIWRHHCYDSVGFKPRPRGCKTDTLTIRSPLYRLYIKCP